MGGKRDDRNASRERREFEEARCLPSVNNGQAHVHDDARGHPLVRRGQAAFAVGGNGHLVSLAHKAAGEHVGVQLVVFDDEDERHGAAFEFLFIFQPPLPFVLRRHCSIFGQ
jgi:hypothetical protein